ncbi:putative cyclin-dependent serine/threonine-protein kinase DDB_G0272797/DDB_G0274007 [Perca fluviatilis]|uniref:putative cyclin-dependent serine/threonine-protein kinase DDB_G0272797/DDB_G0274007 n=1 Tax=Perca fluviatilis TaxID=8168 RepID=UPI0019659828|nr:putative cyclin-dependent serine/threonine-protein kinase DDB_G0272797/DDB_G0274007 [Perca fluviatilis]
MTRRKFKPCPSCQAPNQLSRKTCSSCFTTISKKPKVMAKKVSLDRKWGERVLKNRNAGRVVDSAYIAVKKLSSLGYVPILFFARKDKASGKWVADVVTHLPPTEDNLKIVATMRKAYHFLLIKEGNSTTTLPESQHQAQPESQHQAQPESQHQAQPESQHQAQPESQLHAQPESQLHAQPESQHQAQPESQHQAQPESQHQAQPESQHQAQPESQHQAQPESQLQAQPESQLQAQPESQLHAQPESQLHAQPESQLQAQPESQHQAQPESQHQAQPESQHQAQPESQHQAQPESQHQAQEKETFYLLDLYPVSLPVKEQPPPQKKKVLPEM